MSHKPLNNAEASSASRLLERLAFPLEGLANLTFLVLEEAEHPDKVSLYRRYAARRSVSVMTQILRGRLFTPETSVLLDCQLCNAVRRVG